MLQFTEKNVEYIKIFSMTRFKVYENILDPHSTLHIFTCLVLILTKQDPFHWKCINIRFLSFQEILDLDFQIFM